MAKKPTEQSQEGDRSADEALPPADDSHIAPGDTQIIDASAPADQGGTGDDSSRDKDDLVEVVIAGQTVKLAPETAALIEAEQTAASAAATQSQLASEPIASGDGDRSDDADAELMFSDPAQWKKNLVEGIRKEVTADYSADQQRKGFWDDFYRENDDLRGEDYLVQATLNRHFSVLENMKGRPGRDRLAELTKKDILALTKKYNKPPENNDTTNLEGAAGGEEAPDVPTPKKEPTRLPSLGDAIKQRRLNRAKAARGGNTQAAE